MPLFASSPLIPSLTDALRSTLITTLHERHRPELADLVACADLLDGTGLSVGIAGAVDSAWLAQQLLSAAVEAGVPLQRIQILPLGREENA
jgi:hypothetical protein